MEEANGCESSIEPFDPGSMLDGNKAKEEVAGIKAKRISVYWDGPFLLSPCESLSLEADLFQLISHARQPNDLLARKVCLNDAYAISIDSRT